MNQPKQFTYKEFDDKINSVYKAMIEEISKQFGIDCSYERAIYESFENIVDAIANNIEIAEECYND